MSDGLANWEVFLEWLIGTEEGGALMRSHADVVDRWLRAFNEWAEALVR